MKNLFLILFLILIIFSFTSIVILKGEDKGLTELQKIKAENIKLKTQMLQCQVQIANSQLESEKSGLVIELRKQLGAKNEEVFDWNTLTFKPTDTSDK